MSMVLLRYLLLEDGDTGDVLMPLIYMKAVFEANYSRKLSSLKNRLVVIPSDQELSVGRPNTYLYWQWAFESPPNVKLLVRQELGEEDTPQVIHLLRVPYAMLIYTFLQRTASAGACCCHCQYTQVYARHCKASGNDSHMRGLQVSKEAVPHFISTTTCRGT